MGNNFFARYSELCKSTGETPNSVAKIIGASSGSVTAWKNGAEPRYSTVVKIAEYFNVSVDFLLGKEKTSTGTGERDVLEDVDVAFYGDFKELTEDEKETVRDMVRLMRQRKEKRSQ